MTTATATIELPVEVYALAEQTAQTRHIPLADFVANAVQSTAAQTDEGLEKTFYQLTDLQEENRRIAELLDREFNSSRARQIREDAA